MSVIVLRGYLLHVAVIFTHVMTNMVMSITVPHTCLLFILIMYTEITTTEALITCEAGTFVAGEAASITCKFRTNITASQRALNMALYPPHAPKGAIGKDILLCRWLKQQNNHQCQLEDGGYTFDHVLTDRLTVTLPAVSYDQAGLYMCFYVPSDGTETHPCELTVVEGESQAEQSWLRLGLYCAGGAVALIIVVIVVICLCKRRKNRWRDDDESMPMIKTKGRTIMEHLGTFHMTEQTLQKVMKITKQEMEKGLVDASTRQEADLKMFPTFLTHLPDGTETGEILVLVLDGDSLWLYIVELQAGRAKIMKDKKCDVSDKTKGGEVQQLFYFVADKTNDFISSKDISSGGLPLVFLIAFPCQHKAADTAHLTKWTKETHYEGCENLELRGLLQKALNQRKKEKFLTPQSFDNLNKVKIVAAVNDAVGTLMSVAHSNTNCRICLVVDVGLNACYVEQTPRAEEEEPQERIINTELGALGENGCLEFCRTEFDGELDVHTQSPGQQILEKMVGGRYIGETVRRVLAGLTKNGLLFPSVPSRNKLFEPASFSTQSVIEIESDNEQSHQKTRGVLDGLGLNNYTADDLETVRHVCRTVCERAAFLSAACLAALINHVGQPEVTVVIDGYLYKEHPRFHDLMYSKTLELVKHGRKFCFVSPFYPKCVGAARIAAMSLRQTDPHTVEA